MNPHSGSMVCDELPEARALPCARIPGDGLPEGAFLLDGAACTEAATVEGRWVALTVGEETCWARLPGPRDDGGSDPAVEHALRLSSERLAAEAELAWRQGELVRCREVASSLDDRVGDAVPEPLRRIGARCRLHAVAEAARRHLGGEADLPAACQSLAADLRWALLHGGGDDGRPGTPLRDVEAVVAACVKRDSQILTKQIRRIKSLTSGAGFNELADLREKMLQCDPTYAFIAPREFLARVKRRWRRAAARGADPRHFTYRFVRADVAAGSDVVRVLYERWRSPSPVPERSPDHQWTLLEYRYCGDRWAVAENQLLDEW